MTRIDGAAWVPEKGQRVVLRGSHSYASEHGLIVGSPNRAFNGWTVKLDTGLHVGAADEQMRAEA